VGFLRLTSKNALWQNRATITFRPLSDGDPDLAHSPLLRAARLTPQYAQDHGALGLTKTKVFKRAFVHWTFEHFEWPGSGAEEMFRYNKVISEYEFPPREVLHYLLITLRLARHFKGELGLTNRGAEPAQMFADLFPSSFSRSIMRPMPALRIALLANGESG
jgi:hypothetical protein